ncbi:hypothetical protein VCRA2119O147_560052 [Vibrio crassostreae]|nr:hypothetical protein VCRA2118O236_390030 [Vibrio crassostreae]CAK2101225.1 hypothetical protein VCRA2116O234_410023 [Vibrio crassostreae]CAK2373041.1 hypothetical protein VCRA2119O147_560052 [Vibrio crassostreae]CAK2913519.1 hypothetical protein VCRA2110O183_420050 [Vibrio crassostreae]CAK2988114.1 hypothetical protein VCRA2121O264_420050 [Vibrio crassostreae]
MSAIFAAANQFAQACHAAARGMAEGVKTWLLRRDTSHQKVSALCNGHTVTILAKTPQNDKI